MLLFGRLLSIFWPKMIYLVCIALFEIGSLICAVAPSAEVLIFGRAFAGVGAAGLWVSILFVFAQVESGVHEQQRKWALIDLLPAIDLDVEAAADAAWRHGRNFRCVFRSRTNSRRGVDRYAICLMLPRGVWC